MKSKRTPGKTDTSHTQRAYEGIKQMLFLNEISPGQKISYRQLADRMDMSLTPVIQALKHLEIQGLVKYEPNKGYATEPMSMQEVQEIYDTREIIEISLLPHAIRNLDEEGIKKLQNLLTGKSEPNANKALSEQVTIDREFHMTLARLSGQKIQVQILGQLFDLLYLKYRASILFTNSTQPVGSRHQEIFEAVICQDPDLAQKRMKSHFRSIRTHALKALGKMIAEKKG